MASSTYTPMMQQYFQLRAEHSDALLLYRLGDFYELFFDDAQRVAPLLGLALTKRGYHQGEPIPMCGVPAHTLNFYLKKLTEHGLKIAVCEQQEELDSENKLVQRKVVRVITPGTLTEDNLLESGKNNHLAAVFFSSDDEIALAWVDISTGDFSLAITDLSKLATELLCIEPSELLVNKSGYANHQQLFSEHAARTTVVNDHHFQSQRGEALLKKTLQVANLSSLGEFTSAHLAVCAALLYYVELTQKEQIRFLKQPQFRHQNSLFIDSATRRSLELTQTIAGEKKGSLLSVIDKTVTSGGKRLLRKLFGNPMLDVATINQQLDRIEFLQQSQLLNELWTILRQFPDLERALSRLLIGRGSPRDLALVGNGLDAAQELFILSSKLGGNLLQEIFLVCSGYGALLTKLRAALCDELPAAVNDGNFIRRGYNSVLDNWRNLRDQAHQHLAELQNKYVFTTGVNSLKIKHNNLLGYYVEVSTRYAEKLDNSFVHRQSMASAVRYRTTELTELEQKITQAQSAALAIETELFDQFVAQLREVQTRLVATAQAVATLDLYTSFALLGQQPHYCRPVVDNSKALTITQGWHPVVGTMMTEGQQFIANDCQLENSSQLALVTGPNMAGKSTYLRQNALIVFLAQIGSFVPAEAAQLGIVDRLFSRVGAADDLIHGKSTFMVEMLETATILNQASEQSLVILDEVGRGTSTLDGLAIAWATVEHLHQVTNCRGLLATHYQELTLLEQQLPNLTNLNLAIKEWEDEITFLYQVEKGIASKAYGLHVAKLAGVPSSVLARADSVLQLLESSRQQFTPALLKLVNHQE